MKTESAIFAAGCFWGVQYYFDHIPGVVETQAGYIGGKMKNPSYQQVSQKDTGHAEAVRITYDSNEVSYQTLLQHFFRLHDPTQMNRQGPDIGRQYRSAIFYLDITQKEQAQRLIGRLNREKYSGKIVTTLEKAGDFWPAEDYHQKYTQRTGKGMCHVDYAPI